MPNMSALLTSDWIVIFIAISFIILSGLVLKNRFNKTFNPGAENKNDGNLYEVNIYLPDGKPFKSYKAVNITNSSVEGAIWMETPDRQEIDLIPGSCFLEVKKLR